MNMSYLPAVVLNVLDVLAMLPTFWSAQFAVGNLQNMPLLEDVRGLQVQVPNFHSPWVAPCQVLRCFKGFQGGHEMS